MLLGGVGEKATLRGLYRYDGRVQYPQNTNTNTNTMNSTVDNNVHWVVRRVYFVDARTGLVEFTDKVVKVLEKEPA